MSLRGNPRVGSNPAVGIATHPNGSHHLLTKPGLPLALRSGGIRGHPARYRQIPPRPLRGESRDAGMPACFPFVPVAAIASGGRASGGSTGRASPRCGCRAGLPWMRGRWSGGGANARAGPGRFRPNAPDATRPFPRPAPVGATLALAPVSPSALTSRKDRFRPIFRDDAMGHGAGEETSGSGSSLAPSPGPAPRRSGRRFRPSGRC